MRTTVTVASFAALTMAVGTTVGEAEQIRIVHLNCKQWHARQAMLAARAAHPHPVAHHAAHRFGPRRGPRIHFVCDCVDGADVGSAADGSTDSFSGGSLPMSSGAGGAGDFGQVFATGSPGAAALMAGGGGSAGSGGGIGSGGGNGVQAFSASLSEGSSAPDGSSTDGFSSPWDGPSSSGDSSSPDNASSGGSSSPDSPTGPSFPTASPLPEFDAGPSLLPAAPEPSTWVLFGLGAVALGALKGRKRRSIAARAS